MKGRKFIAKPSLWTKLTVAAGNMRGAPTLAEAAMWEQLRNRRFNRLKFRRQHPIDRFVVDFFCPEKALVIEIDGPIHNKTIAEDKEREEILTAHGLKVLRFPNENVLQNMAGVLRTLEMALKA